MGLLGHLENELRAAGETPISISPRRPALEAVVIDAWSRGENLSIAGAGRRLEGAETMAAGGQAHGDGHGDEHGDHTDAR